MQPASDGVALPAKPDWEAYGKQRRNKRPAKAGRVHHAKLAGKVATHASQTLTALIKYRSAFQRGAGDGLRVTAGPSPLCAGSDQPMAAMAASVRATSPTNNATVPMKAIGHGSATKSSSASMRERSPDSLLINVDIVSIACIQCSLRL